VANLPQRPETFHGIETLCRQLLDPLVEHFGRPELTYGFASPQLTRHIRRGIAPQLDQHAGHERRKNGPFICDRLGQAVDLRVPTVTASEVARHVVTHLDFDRIYLYGDDRPLHLSVGPERNRVIIEMTTRSDGRRAPRKTWKASHWVASLKRSAT